MLTVCEGTLKMMAWPAVMVGLLGLKLNPLPCTTVTAMVAPL